MSKVSIIMPSYNKELYISQAIDSILRQSFKDFELLIIDDVSSDNSVEIIKSYSDKRIRFFQNKDNLGMASTRNIGLSEAKGEYIALLDADDISTEDRLEKEVLFLDQCKDIDIVFGKFQEIDENNVIKELYHTPLKNPLFIKAKLLVKDVIPNGSCMYRKSFVDKYNIRYRDNCFGLDDYLFWVECSIHGKITGLPDLFLYWRNVRENSTNTFKNDIQYKEKRRKKYADIQKIALKSNGFLLKETELDIYTKFFAEEKYKIQSKEEILDLFLLLKKLCLQANKKDNASELKLMYKKSFGLLLENSYIWENDFI
ncbi:hypothetical protein C824_004200 [Schaedlerella arabinosiphila]|nr:hypothetical protein C824_004200 [Schaedlerella arabinosiphila]